MPSKWKLFDWDHSWYEIKPRPGCYAVYLDKRLTYVGQSADVRQRIANHFARASSYHSELLNTPWGRCQDLKVKIRYAVKYGDWAMVELRLIRRLRPPGNCASAGKERRKSRRTYNSVRSAING